MRLFFIENEDEENIRLDKFLQKKIGLSSTLVQKLIRTKKVLINGEHTINSYRMKKNDVGKLIYYVEHKQEDRKLNNNSFDIEKLIIYESPKVIVINKKAGMYSQGGKGINNSLDKMMKDLSKKKQEKPYLIVHRLDKDTAGLMMFAKGREMAKKISEAFQAREIRKTYLTIIEGKLLQRTEVNKPIKNAPFKCVIDQDGKEAISIFYPISYHKTSTLCFVEIITGRKHQIRVHAASISHPIVSDSLYGKKSKHEFFLLCFNINIQNGSFNFTSSIDKNLDAFKEDYYTIKQKLQVLHTKTS